MFNVGRRLTIIVAALIMCVAVGILIYPYLDWVAKAGRNLPVASSDLRSDYLVGVTGAMLICFSILCWPISMQHKLWTVGAWLARCFVTLGFMLVVERHYQQMDAYRYFSLPQAAGFVQPGLHVGAGTNNVMQLIWWLQRILPPSFHLLMIVWSLVGFIATYLFYRAAVLITGKDDMRLFLAFTLFPSVLVWSSLLGKDPINLLGVALYTLGAVGWQRTARPRYIVVCASGIVISIFIRSWYGPAMVIPLVALVLWARSEHSERQTVFTKLLLACVVLAGLAVVWGQSRYASSFNSTSSLLETSNGFNDVFSGGGSSQQAVQFTSLFSLFRFLPYGMITALFRPLPGEVRNIFGLFAGLESLVVLGLAFLAVRRLRRSDLRDPLVIWALSYVLIWAAMYGIAVYGNLGALVRYRLQTMPIFLGLLLYLARPQAAPRRTESEEMTGTGLNAIESQLGSGRNSSLSSSQ